MGIAKQASNEQVGLETESSEGTEANSESLTQKTRKGIRNKAMKKTDQGLEIVHDIIDPVVNQAVEGCSALVLPVKGAEQTQSKASETIDLSNAFVDDSSVVHQASPQKLRKGIRNKAMKKADGHVEAMHASKIAGQVGNEVLLDLTSAGPVDVEQQRPQGKHNKILEQMGQGIEIHGARRIELALFSTLNLERVHDTVVLEPDWRGASPIDTGALLIKETWPSTQIRFLGTGHAHGLDMPTPSALAGSALDSAPAPANLRQAKEEAGERHVEGQLEAKVESGPLSVSDLLKWRPVVGDEHLENLLCCALPCESQDTVSKSWREEAGLSQKNKEKKGSKENQHKNFGSKQPALQKAENSWSAQQRVRTRSSNSNGKSDEEIVRDMKSILNKLTMTKYDTLYRQILTCGMTTIEHVMILIDEILEKAQTQHNFIQMYCQLCVDLHKWFVEQESTQSADTREHSFRHILLNQCQNKFEENLLTPDLSSMQEEEVAEAMIKHKLAMLGNIKFIAALLEMRMLNCVCLNHIAHQLCETAAPHTLESLACFLTAVGPKFAQPKFRHYEHLQVIFAQVEEKSKDKSIAPRIRFLLRDLLDLQKAGWSRSGR